MQICNITPKKILKQKSKIGLLGHTIAKPMQTKTNVKENEIFIQDFKF